MSDRPAPIPPGYHTVTPYLVVDGAAKAIEFYKQAFAAEEVLRMPMPDGRVGHAEVRIGDSHVMLADAFPERGYEAAPCEGKWRSPSIHLYVEDVDAVFARAVEAGAKVFVDVADQFYGDRRGCLIDPFGQSWSIATHIEDVSEEELKQRFDAMMKNGECG